MEFFTKKQFESHKKICRGDEEPPLSGDEDYVSDAELIEINDGDEDLDPEKYGTEMRPVMSRREMNQLFDKANRPRMTGKREGEDSKWKHPKRIKGRAPPEMGMDQIKMVVGSKLARDLKRRTHFMGQKAFDAWQTKYDKKNRYWAEERDVDGDDIDDFVVSKARTAYNKDSKKWDVVVDEEGNPIRDLVAVNGWTTVKSDYKERKQFVDEYPTAKDRKGKSFTKFIHSKYYTEADQDEFGYPNHEYIERRQRVMYDEGHKHKLHMPLPTARQDFMKRLIWRAYKEAVDAYLERHPDMERKDVQMEPGFVARVGAFYWHAWILETLFNDISESEYYKDLFVKYIKKFNNSKFNKDKGVQFDEDNKAHMEKFWKTLLKKDSVRKGINSLVKQLLKEDGEYFAESLSYMRRVMMEKILEQNS